MLNSWSVAVDEEQEDGADEDAVSESLAKDNKLFDAEDEVATVRRPSGLGIEG